MKQTKFKPSHLVSIISTMALGISAHAHSSQVTQQKVEFKGTDSSRIVTRSINSSDSQRYKNRYIVELNAAPSLMRKKQLQSVSATATLSSNQLKQISQYETDLQLQQQQLSKEFINSKQISKVHRQFFKVQNALEVEASSANIKQLEKHPMVKAVYPVVTMRAYLSESTSIVGADSVWQSADGFTGEGIDVAVLDTGVDYHHPDLGGCFGDGCKVYGGYDFTTQGEQEPTDVDGHGTHVAGIVAANGSYKGVAPDARILAVKVLGDDGFGANSDIIAGIEYAVDPDGDPATDDGVDIINMSLGGESYEDDPLTNAANTAVEAGIVVVVAAGNDGNYGDIANHSPANAEQAITVGSTTKDDQISDFSSKGPGLDGESIKPELVAPGDGILSMAPGTGYTTLSGTSMAAPHVAGAAALLLNAYPNASPAEIKQRLMAGAKNIDADLRAQGSGRMDIPAAIAAQFAVKEGGADFGRLGSESGAIELVKTLTLTNFTDAEKRIDINADETLTDGIGIALSKNQLTLPANGEGTIDVTLTINSPADIPYPDDSPLYFSTITLTDDGSDQVINAPIGIEKSLLLKIKNLDVPGKGAYLSLRDENNSLYWDYIYQDQELTFTVTPGQFTIIADYRDITADMVPQLGLPTDNDIKVQGHENRIVDIAADTEITLSLNNLTKTVAPTELDGSLKTASTSRAISFSGNGRGWSSTSNMFPNQDTGEEITIVQALGDTDERIKLTLSAAHYQATGDDQYSHFLYWTDGKDIQSDTTYNATSVYDFPIRLSNTSPYLSNTFDTILALLDDGSTSSPTLHLHQPESSDFYVSKDADSNIALQFAVGDPFAPGAESAPIFVTGDDTPSTDKLILNQALNLNFAQQGITPRIHGQWQPSGFNDYTWKAFSGHQGVIFPDLDDVHYRIDCADGSHHAGDYFRGISIGIPSGSCDDARLTFSYTNILEGTPYNSKVEHQIGGEYAILEGIKIRIEKDGLLSLNNWADSSHKLLLGMAQDRVDTPEIDSIELRVSQGEWQTLDWYQSGVERNALFHASLPAIEGIQVADIRVTYGNGSLTTSVQTVNGFMLLGEDANVNLDSDGDGIPNNEDTDDDNDGLPDTLEIQLGLNPTSEDNSQQDLDNDGLTNIEEYQLGTRLDVADTDGDGVSDGREVQQGTDPLDGSSKPDYYVFGDYNGDGRADFSMRNVTTAMNYIHHTDDDSIGRHSFGKQSHYIPLTGDFDGDGKGDIAMRDPLTFKWYIQQSSDNTIRRETFGKHSDDIPVLADYDGDGKTDIAVRRPSTAMWYILRSSDNQIERVNFGSKAEDIPVPADYDGDGKADIAVRRPSTQMWYILNSSGSNFNSDRGDGIQRINFGKQAEDIPVPADYDGDGKADIAVRRPSTQMWYIKQSSDDNIQRIRFGLQSTDIPVVADYDGDGKGDIAVRRNSNYHWYTISSETGEITRTVFGKNSAYISPLTPISILMEQLKGESPSNNEDITDAEQQWMEEQLGYEAVSLGPVE